MSEAEVVSVDVTTEAAPVVEAPIEATEAVEEVKEEIKEVVEEKAKEDPLSSRFALLTRREKELREREQSVKGHEQKAKELQEIIDGSKKSPIEALKAAGYTYEQATNFILNDGKPTDEMALNAEKDRIGKLESRLSERDKADANIRYHAEVETYKGSISNHLDSGADKYQMINSLNNKRDVVYDVMESHHRETGVGLSLDEACAYIEDGFKDQFSSFIGTPKGRALAESFLGVKPEATKPEEPQVIDSNTLTNKASTQVPTPRERQLTNEESIVEAAKLLQYSEE
jgi:hypothetical protein